MDSKLEAKGITLLRKHIYSSDLRSFPFYHQKAPPTFVDRALNQSNHVLMVRANLSKLTIIREFNGD
ncbi:MAG TPA: hypothetical protein DCZ98_01430 [Cryomorphaceae bacterium]|nr:hypothetical protein [Cryomorphaceae bacterium]